MIISTNAPPLSFFSNNTLCEQSEIFPFNICHRWYWIAVSPIERAHSKTIVYNCLFTSPALLLVDFIEEVCQTWIGSCREKKSTLFSSAFSDPPPGHVFTHTGCIGWGALGNPDPLWWQPLFACPTNITYITSHTNALPYISLHFTRHCLPVHLHRGH